MPTRIHEFRTGTLRCSAWQRGDGMTARMDAVTCPECRRVLAGAEACLASSPRFGRRCVGARGHGGPHRSDHHGVVYVWLDSTSPERLVAVAAGAG